MQRFVRGSLLMAALGTALAVASAAPASAQLARPQSLAGVDAGGDLVTQVQWRGRGGGGYRGGYRGGYGRGYGGAGIGLGLATGLIVGGALAARPYYGAPAYGYGPPPDEVGYCMQRFKSYDPASGTYLGYDGMRHPCP
jgi:hypothetical protein